MIAEVFKVLTEQWRTIFGLLLFVALGQSLAGKALKSLYDDKLTAIEYFSLGLAGWILPIFLISLLWLLLGFTSSVSLNRLVLPLGILLFLVMLWRGKAHFRFDSGAAAVVFFLLAFVLASILLRLVFLSRAIFPSYFDSAQHYTIIQDILRNGMAGLLASKPYYHSGYHILTAFLATALNVDIPKFMLVFGQMVLGMMPVAPFFLVKHMTRSDSAGLFAVMLSAFGWYMPAHAVNWGKYPALTSLALLPFVLSLVYLLMQNWAEFSTRKRGMQYIVTGFSILVLILLHSRAVVILAILFLAWGIAAGQGRLSFPIRTVLFVAVSVAVLLELLYIDKQGVLAPLIDPYLHKGIWITAIVLVLSLFALKEYSSVAFACLVAVGFLLAGIFVPIQIPGYGALTLLDRPLVEMILYLPVAFLGGLGLAGLEKRWRQPRRWKFLRREYMYGVITLLIAIHALTHYNFYPADCCVLVGSDDLAALTWMKEHLPGDARVGISVTELNVLPSEAFEAYNGADAGIWIGPFINRTMIPFPYSSDFGAQPVRDLVCQNGVNYLYIGARGAHFDLARLQEHPEWYQALLSQGNASVYAVIGCG